MILRTSGGRNGRSQFDDCKEDLLIDLAAIRESRAPARARPLHSLRPFERKKKEKKKKEKEKKETYQSQRKARRELSSRQLCNEQFRYDNETL